MKDSILLKRIWHFAKPYKWAFLISYSVLLIELVFNQLLPLFLEKVVNFAVYNTDLSNFIFAALQYALIFLGYAACGYIQLILWQRVHNKYVYDVRIACYGKILRMKPKILADIKTGDVIHTINSDATEFHHIIQRFAMRIFNAGIGTVVSLGIVAFIKWEIALLMIVIIPISAIICKVIETKIKSSSEMIRTKQGDYSAWLLEMLKGLQEIKLHVAEKTVFKLFVQKNTDIIQESKVQDGTRFKSDQIINGIYFFADILFYIICALFVADGSINIGQYTAVASYFSMVSWNVKRILQGNADYQQRKVCVERVFTLLDEEEENEDGLFELEVNKGDIVFEDLSFSYEGDSKVLNNLNLHIYPGEKIGVVGRSGVGKSTLANLLIRFYDPQRGQILIDGQPLAKCKYSSIRKSIGIVNQENIVFNASARENITLGKIVDEKELWEVLEKVDLSEEIKKLPFGLDTVLGGNVSLSGGQNQRLCIARLMLQNPKIIILDEATGALDIETEEKVQNALDALSENKTTIIISHRYKSLLKTNRVLVLQEGESVGLAHYEELFEENKCFFELFSKQKGLTV